MKSHLRERIRWIWFNLIILIILTLGCVSEVASQRKTWLFLGNSITYNGRYVDYIETSLLLQRGESAPEIINLGLSSETLSGMSEPDHPFPRPALLSRLTACLDSVNPTQVIACYGINCGIYAPFDSIRFAAYTTGIRQLIQETKAKNIKLILMTPGPFAAAVAPPLTPDTVENYSYQQPYPQYNAVMEQYANWLLTEVRQDSLTGVEVINIFDPLTQNLQAAYSSDDPIHPNPTGHALIAEAFLKQFELSSYPTILSTGYDSTQQDLQWKEIESLVKAQRLSYDRALLNRIGHGNPMIQNEDEQDWEQIQQNYQVSKKQLSSTLERISGD